jgi:hypothetical protein
MISTQLNKSLTQATKAQVVTWCFVSKLTTNMGIYWKWGWDQP